jgi:translocation and assembly module TamA
VAGAGLFTDCPTACTLTYPELRYTYDARDNAIEPTQGFFASARIQQTLKPGSFSYFRMEPEVRVFFPVTKLAVFAARVHYGGMIPEPGDAPTPFTQRFFVGGQNEQRGFAPQRQGPKLGVNPVCDKSADPTCLPYARQSVPIGGKAALVISAELRIHADWLLNHLGFVPFVDASQVSNDWKNPVGAGLEISPGLGLRYITPFGPIRFDIAWVLNPKDIYTLGSGDQILPTRVSVDCDKSDTTCIHESRFAFHVTLGEAF